MPAYPWLYRDRTDFKIIQKKLSVMKTLGVPYTEQDIQFAESRARTEAQEIVAGLKSQGLDQAHEDHEIVALIAYLQRLGADFKKGLIK